MSAETMYSAPAWAWSLTLSWPIFADTGSSNTENVPPNPQHSSGRCGFTNSMPLTVERRSMGFEKRRSTISDAEASRSARNVEQPLCRPTLCGNTAQGNALTLTMSCRNSTSSKVRSRTAVTSGVCAIAMKWSRT